MQAANKNAARSSITNFITTQLLAPFKIGSIYEIEPILKGTLTHELYAAHFCLLDVWPLIDRRPFSLPPVFLYNAASFTQF